MDEDITHIVYSKNVLEFVRVAGEYTIFLEDNEKYSRSELLFKLQKILPLLYLKASLLPQVESTHDEIVEKFVTENEWNVLEDQLKQKLGKFNDYLEVFDPDIAFSEGPLNANIAENLADIFQDTKDFTSAYSIGTTEVMNDALWECKDHFEQYWGQKLLNTLRAIHQAIYSNEELEDEDELETATGKNENIDTSNWLISKRLEEYRDINDEE